MIFCLREINEIKLSKKKKLIDFWPLGVRLVVLFSRRLLSCRPIAPKWDVVRVVVSLFRHPFPFRLSCKSILLPFDKQKYNGTENQFRCIQESGAKKEGENHRGLQFFFSRPFIGSLTRMRCNTYSKLLHISSASDILPSWML